MSKFSVKKPFTVFVAVIAILVLGVVSYLKMTPDLLPNMDFPYIMIMTTYPGASPEKVENEISRPLEQAMSTMENIKTVSSTSSENYSMVMLEFEESTDLDVIGVDIQQSLTALQAGWDDMVGVPYVLKINPSMLPIQVAAVSMEGMSTVELTDFLNETLMNKLEGISGVARISASGTVEQKLHVVLDQEKIDNLNEKIVGIINGQLDDAVAELDEKKAELEKAQADMDAAKEQLDAGKNALAYQTAAGEAELQNQIAQLQSAKMQLQTTLELLKTVRSGLTDLEAEAGNVEAQLNHLLGLQQKASELTARRNLYSGQIQAIENDPLMTREQKDAAIAEITGSADYLQTEAEWAQLQAELAVYGLTADQLPGWIQISQDDLAALKAQVEELYATLAEQGLTGETLDAEIAKMEETMLQLDDGIAQLKSATSALSSGKTAALLELSSAATELAVGNSSIASALMQIESGYDTIESSREEALAKTDLNEILTMEMVGQILAAQNFSMPAGYIQQNGVSYMLSVGEEITDLQTLEGLLLFDMNMEGIDPIYLTDVANVMLTDNRNETYSRLNGENSITLNFEKQSTYATAEATDNILARFEELEEEYPGLRFVSLMNQGDYIYLLTDTIINSLLLGALFSVLILFVFLKDIRPTFITLCSIPISVIFAIVLMYFSGVTINIISLSGLAVAVGMLVDNSVVVIENIYRLRSKGANAIQAAVSGAGQVAGAVTSSTLTTVCVFLPIVFVEGITKQLFTDLALTMTYALLASLIVSLTLVPAMASGLLRKEKLPKAGFMDRFNTAYRRVAAWTLDHKAVVLIAAAALLIVTAAAGLSRGFIFMPAMDMPNVNMTISMPEDATMEEAVGYADEVMERIATVDGIATVGASMSSGSALSGSSGVSYDVTVYVTLSDEKGSGSEVGKKIVDLCADLPCEVSASSAMMDMSMLSGSGLSMNIYAQNMNDLQAAAKKAAAELQKVEGLAEISDGLEESAPALHIAVDRNKAMAKGLTVAQVYMELAEKLTTSTTAATLQLGGTSTDVIIEKPEGAKLTVDDLKLYRFEVTGQDGSTNIVWLDSIAEIEETTSLTSISRADQRRYVTVTAGLEEGYNITKVTAQAQRLMEDVDLGEGVTYAFAGENETIMEAVEQLGLMLLLGVLLVYLVMVAQFQSLKSPFIVMFTIPLAFTGGFIALLICGMEVSVISLIGFIMLTGIIVNNGIVLVDYINQLRLEGKERREAILEAGATRMRPILMTSITTILGLIDMATNDAAGTAMMRPVAVVCIGGLIYATLMTLFVVPCIYDMLNKKELRNVREEDLKMLDI